jgi:hypothetical protein
MCDLDVRLKRTCVCILPASNIEIHNTDNQAPDAIPAMLCYKFDGTDAFAGPRVQPHYYDLRNFPQSGAKRALEKIVARRRN